jgi:hypothetical protein
MRREISDDEVLHFAKSYLSEAFPNPQRIGCPPDWELIRMSEHPKEKLHAESVNTLRSARPVLTATWTFWAS